jgi:uncharacterized protein YybS (DUF2232 family)
MFRDYALMAQEQGLGSTALGGMSMEEFVKYILSLLPSVMFLTAMVLTFVSYSLMGRLLRRLGNDIPKLPPFREWRLDWRLLWPLIIALFTSSLGERLHHELLAQIANNLLSAMLIIFLVSGLAVLIWVLWRFKAAGFIKALAVLFAIQLFSGAVLILAGVFDPLFDIRGRLEQYIRR